MTGSSAIQTSTVRIDQMKSTVVGATFNVVNKFFVIGRHLRITQRLDCIYRIVKSTLITSLNIGSMFLFS